MRVASMAWASMCFLLGGCLQNDKSDAQLQAAVAAAKGQLDAASSDADAAVSDVGLPGVDADAGVTDVDSAVVASDVAAPDAVAEADAGPETGPDTADSATDLVQSDEGVEVSPAEVADAAAPADVDGVETTASDGELDSGVGPETVDVAEVVVDVADVAVDVPDAQAEVAMDANADAPELGPEVDAVTVEIADAATADAVAADASTDAADGADGAPEVVQPACTAAGCNDGNACTVDSCGPDQKCQHNAQVGVCDSKTPCAPGTCEAGVCKAVAKVCDDANPCTADACDAATGACQYAPVPCYKPPCASDSQCSGGYCDKKLNACVACLSDSHCPASAKLCQGGVCKPGVQCATDVQCKTAKQVCDSAAGHCVDCVKDGDCGAAEYCLANACAPKQACTSSKVCASVCAIALGMCVQCNGDADCATGWGCTAQHQCVPKVCGGNVCFAGAHFVCNGTAFSAGNACADGNGCTQDLCDPAIGCSNPSSPTGTACDDGQACAGDYCKAGSCVGVPLAFEATFAAAAVTSTYPIGAVTDDSGGTFVVAQTTPVGGQSGTGWVGRLDGAGKLKWQYQGAAGDSLWAVAPGSNGGAVAVGSQVGEGGNPAYAIRLNSNGKVAWSKTYQKGAQMYAVAPLSSTSVVVGGTAPNANLANTRAVWRLSLVDGSVSQFVQLEPEATKYGTGSVQALTVANGKLWLAGSRPPTTQSQTNYYSSVSRLHLDTLAVEADWISSFESAPIVALAVATDGSVYALNSSGDKPKLSVLTADLKMANEYLLPFVTTPKAIAALQQGQLAVAGEVQGKSLGSSDAVVARLDGKTGTVTSKQTFGSVFGELATAVIAQPDGGLTVVGPRFVPGVAPSSGMWAGALWRLDPWGNTACACLGGTSTAPCNDNNPCTLDACDLAKGCTHTALADALPCDDGNPYHADGKCLAGQCKTCSTASLPVADNQLGMIRVAPDGSLRGVTAYGNADGVLASVGVDGKLAWQKQLKATLDMPQPNVQWIGVRNDGGVVLYHLQDSSTGSFWRFDAKGEPIQPAKFALSLPLDRFFLLGTDKIIYMNLDSGQKIEERQYTWGNSQSSGSLQDFNYAGMGLTSKFTTHQGAVNGQLLLCIYGELAGSGGTIGVFRRNPASGTWPVGFKATVSGIGLTVECADWNGDTGVIVIGQDSVSSKAAAMFDDDGKHLWTAQAPWVKGILGFSQLGGSVYAWGKTGEYQWDPTVVHKLDAGGKIVGTATLEKPYALPFSRYPRHLQPVGGGFVLAGVTTFKTEPAVGPTHGFRAQLSASLVWGCGL